MCMHVYIYMYLQILVHSYCIIIVLYRKTAGSALDSCQFIVDIICIIAGSSWGII